MTTTAYFRSASRDLPRWRELCYGIMHAVPAFDYAGHHFSVHQLQMAYSPPGTQMLPHKHTFYEGIVILSGAAQETSGQEQHLVPGTMLINPPEIMHGWEALNSNMLRFGIWFTVDKPLNFRAGAPHPQDKETILQVAGLLEAARSPGAGWPDCTKARLLLLMASILQTVEWPTSYEVDRPSITRNVGAVVNDFLRNNMSQPLSLRDIATHCGLSVPTLTRHLRQEGHAGAMSTLHIFRMEMALDLVRNTALSTGKIAMRVGMPDSSYFNRCFRDQYGCSPGQYRANLSKLPPNAG